MPSRWLSDAAFARIALAATCASLACAGPEPASIITSADSTRLDGLLFRGHVALAGRDSDTLMLAVELLNQRKDTLTLEYGACAMDPRLIRPGHADAHPAYAFSSHPESSVVRFPDGRMGAIHVGCPSYLVRAVVPPGGSARAPEFQWKAALDSIAGDSLHGTFDVVVRLRFLSVHTDVPAGTVRLP